MIRGSTELKTEFPAAGCEQDRESLSQVPRLTKKLGSVALAVAFVVPDALAVQPLQPSGIYTGDCVAPRIKAIPSGMSFFSNQCSESDFFVGLGGSTYLLHRTDGKTSRKISLEGSFAGEDISVEVRAVGLRLKECEIPGPAEGKSDGVWTVTIIARRGNESARIEGIYDDCMD